MVDKQDFKKKHFFLAVVLIGLALSYLALPKSHYNKQLKPNYLLNEIIDDTLYLSTDEVSEMIINDDNIILVDIRTSEEYSKYHLPGAYNIPLEDLLSKKEDGSYKWANVINQDRRKVIFYSNGSIHATQAWILLRRLRSENNYAMKGGLNKWFSTIILPEKPAPDASDAEQKLYETRRAASKFFTGNPNPDKNTTNDDAPTEIIDDSEKPEEEVGGC